MSITGDQIRKGTMVTFDVGVSEQENVSVIIETKNTYAIGFFMDNVQNGWVPASLPATTVNPEPATMAMLALGLGGLLRRRFRK